MRRIPKDILELWLNRCFWQIERLKIHNEHIAVISYKYKIPLEYIYSFLAIEMLNRGQLMYLKEKFLLKYFYSFSKKNDLSIGPAQIKISFAKKLYPSYDEKQLIRFLYSMSFSIELTAQIIQEAMREISIYDLNPSQISKTQISNIVSYYVVRKSQILRHKSSRFYIELFYMLSNSDYFRRIKLSTLGVKEKTVKSDKKYKVPGRLIGDPPKRQVYSFKMPCHRKIVIRKTGTEESV